MKILVTGGAGFIGSNLVNALIELGHEVTVFDNLSKGRKENVDNRAAFVEGDVKDIGQVARAVKGAEVVFHLAAITDIRNANDDAVYNTNFMGAKNVFDAAAANNAKIIFASSAAVYGNGNIPNKEDGECKPLSQYGKSKLQAEKYLQRKTENYFIARFFNVYGPNSQSAVNKFCKKISNYQDIEVFGNGMQTRDYIYIDDVVDALILGIRSIGIYNVGTGQDISTHSLIEMIHNMTRAPPNRKDLPANKGDIARSRADITKIKQIGWTPRIGLEEGLWKILDSVGYKKLA